MHADGPSPEVNLRRCLVAVRLGRTSVARRNRDFHRRPMGVAADLVLAPYLIRRCGSHWRQTAGSSTGQKGRVIVAASTAASFYWAMFIEPNLPKLPNWFLFLLALPLDPDGIAYDGRGHAEPGLDMPGLRGIIFMVSIGRLLCLIGLIAESIRELRNPIPDATHHPETEDAK